MAYEPLNAGDLNKIVTIQSRTDTDDSAGGGGLTPTWATIGSWYVGISTTGGREFRRAQQVQPELTHEIKGRFRTDVSARHRLLYVSNNVQRIFTIQAAIDTDERHEQLVCHCTELVS